MRRSVRVLVASTLIAAGAFSLDGVAQDKKPEPPPAPTGAAPVALQQDKIDIGNVLDSWYKIYQKEQVVGYAHEVLSRARTGSQYRYSYAADSEMELVVPDPKDPKKSGVATESLRIENAQLDDTYSPISMTRRDNRADLNVESKVLIDDSSNKRIEMVVGGGSDRKTIPVSPDEEVHFSRFLMFISLRQNGKLAKPGTQRALLFEPRADEQTPIAEVQLEVHEVLKRAYFDKKEVSVTRVSYLKPPPAPTRDGELLETFIDKFGRIVEETTRGGIRRVIVKDEVEAIGQNERPRLGGRRDPFDKRLVMTQGPKPENEGAGKPPLPDVDPKNFAKTLKEIDALIEDLKKARDERRDDEGQKVYERLITYFVTIRQIVPPLAPDQQAVVERKHQEVEEVWGGLERLMKQLRGIYVQVTEAFNKDECGSMEKGIEDLKKAVATRKELEETSQLTQILKWIGELEPLVGKCKTRIELGRKKLILSGTMLHEDVQVLPVDVSVSIAGHLVGGIQDVRFTKPNRIAVINEKMYRVGDVVEGEGVRLEKIWAFGIQVSLREETREVGIRQQK
ncbi:MAG TPA: hypothetical protein VMU54_19380 [Planctomycetota bacterium]|nr:hypothetical protein [Planctomycetota bacterium]